MVVYNCWFCTRPSTTWWADNEYPIAGDRDSSESVHLRLCSDCGKDATKQKRYGQHDTLMRTPFGEITVKRLIPSANPFARNTTRLGDFAEETFTGLGRSIINRPTLGR